MEEAIKIIINKMELEKYVFDSLKHEELNEEFINRFIETMKKFYNENISALKDIKKEMESKNKGDENGK